MIEENLIFEKREGKTYPLLPKKIYQAELLNVSVNVNETYNSKMGKTEEKKYQNDINWQFTLLAGRDEVQEKEELKELRGRNIWESYGKDYLYIGKTGKNDLYRVVEAFLGRELTQQEEAEGISSALLNSFVGKQIMLSIEPKTSKAGKTFDNIIDYLGVATQLTPLTEEEKENARVKTDEEKTENKPIQQQTAPAQTTVEKVKTTFNGEEVPADEINVGSIPF